MLIIEYIFLLNILVFFFQFHVLLGKGMISYDNNLTFWTLLFSVNLVVYYSILQTFNISFFFLIDKKQIY